MTEMTDKYPKKDFLTTTQAARLLSVSPDTVLKWVRAGKVKSRRTLGGHFRIPLSELNIPPSDVSAALRQAPPAPAHYYCWEYLAAGGEIKAECMDCITYRSRAMRCYELKDLPEGLGCLNLLCDTDCSECEYFKVVNGQETNVLVVSGTKKILTDQDPPDAQNGFRISFAASEYEAAVMIQSFRPDYIVVDCSFGKNRTLSICRNLFADIRIPVIRIILSSKTRRIQEYCDKEVFGWIRRPFSLSQLRDCIRGVPRPVGETGDE
jgi:excisionase family DNA binding protein